MPNSLEAEIGGIIVGEGHKVRVAGVINASPESFYKGSVRTTRDSIAEIAKKFENEGADFIDVGGMSTAPYLQGEVLKEEEIKRISSAIEAIRSETRLPISVDTYRANVARVAIDKGARIINDVSGLKADPKLSLLASEHQCSIIVLSHENRPAKGEPIARIKLALKDSLKIAKEHGIPEGSIVVDPAIGFFRKGGKGFGFSYQADYPWYQWDCAVLANIRTLYSLGRPICVGVSRKSFIGKLAGVEKPEERLAGSISATAIAVLNGAHVIRTHDVWETIQAIRVAEAVRKQFDSGSF